MMDAEFLQSVLSTSDSDPKLLSFTQETARPDSSGIMTVIYRLHLDWDWEKTDEPKMMDYPKTIIIKSPATSGTTFEHFVTDLYTSEGENKKQAMLALAQHFVATGYQAECKFYNLFRKLSIVPLPRVFYANCNNADQPQMIVMEDLEAPGKGMQIRMEDGLRSEQLKEVAGSIAKLHAYSLANTDIMEMLPELGKYICVMFCQHFPRICKGLTIQRPSMGSKLEKYLSYLSEDFLLRCVTPNTEFFTNTPSRSAGEKTPSVLASLNIEVRNLFFKKNADQPNGGGELLALADWKMVHSGHPGSDLARLLVGSCGNKLRRAETSAILHHYYQSLRVALNNEVPFSFQVLEDCYKQAFYTAAGFFIYVVSERCLPANSKPDEALDRLLDDAEAAIDDALEILES